MTSADRDEARELLKFVDRLEAYPLMWVRSERFEVFAAAIVGFTAAGQGTLLHEFTSWMGDRHPDFRAHAFTSLILVDALGMAPPRSDQLSEDQERAANRALFARLREFLSGLEAGQE